METVDVHVLRVRGLASRRLPSERVLRQNAGPGRPALAGPEFLSRAAPACGGGCPGREETKRSLCGSGCGRSSTPAAEGAYTLRHEAAHYPRAKVGYSGPLGYDLEVRGAPAPELIRKLHRADNFGWTDDETGQSSYLMTVDEGLREQIGLFMRHCGIDPAPAP